MGIILIVDDKEDERQGLSKAVRDLCQASAQVVEFDGQDDLREGDSYETHISGWIDRHCAGMNIDLIVCDKELGRYQKLRGLSATPVSAVATQRGIPFCQYSRQAAEDDREFARFKRLRQWSSEQITLDGLSIEDWSQQILSLFEGYTLLRTQYDALNKEGATPAGALAHILGHTELESRIGLYGSGDQGFLGEILTYYDPEDAHADMTALYARMPRLLGNWLFLSILRFPGIVVNTTAAASHLNIATSDFKKPDIASIFDGAKYRGPFCDHSIGPWWWRDDLDSLVHESGYEDGRELALRQVENVQPCNDDQTGERAGYYCMLTLKPVSATNSRGNVSWFPSGADLARIRKDKFDSITALVGMY